MVGFGACENWYHLACNNLKRFPKGNHGIVHFVEKPEKILKNLLICLCLFMTATQITFMNNSYLTSVKDTVRETQRYSFEESSFFKTAS